MSYDVARGRWADGGGRSMPTAWRTVASNVGMSGDGSRCGRSRSVNDARPVGMSGDGSRCGRSRSVNDATPVGMSGNADRSAIANLLARPSLVGDEGDALAAIERDVASTT